MSNGLHLDFGFPEPNFFQPVGQAQPPGHIISAIGHVLSGLLPQPVLEQ